MKTNILKKFMVVLIGSILVSTSFAWYFDFSHSPISDLKIINKELSNWNRAIWYSWKTSQYINKVPLSDINTFFSTLWYFKFFKYSHFWTQGSFDDLRNEDLDFSDLAWKKLRYPIVWAYLWDYVVLFIYKESLTPYQKKVIWNYYNYDWLEVQKYKNWYKTKIMVYDSYFFTYDFPKYYKMLTTLNKSLSVLNFQVWQNPLDKYNVEWFSDDVMQLEVKIWSTLRWILASMNSDEDDTGTIVSNTIQYGEDYQKDVEMMDSLTDLYDSVKYYYKITWRLPEDLWSMQPNFIDITALNQYNHQINYERVNVHCYKIWFKPFSSSFKRIYSSQVSKTWYWYSNSCVQ